MDHLEDARSEASHSDAEGSAPSIESRRGAFAHLSSIGVSRRADSPHIGVSMHHPPGSETTSADVAAATAVLAAAAATAEAARCVVAAARNMSSVGMSCRADNRNTARNQPYRRPAPPPMVPPMRRQQSSDAGSRLTMGLAGLSGDEQCIIFSQLCNVLDPGVAVAFGSISNELRTLTQAERQQLRADYEAATVLCRKMGMQIASSARHLVPPFSRG